MASLPRPVTIKYTGGGGISMVLDGAGTVIQRTMSLPGGVQYAVNSDSTEVWSYPNLHGDVILTADGAGARTGRFAFDPFGQPIDPVSGAIGSGVADDAVPDNLPGDATGPPQLFSSTGGVGIKIFYFRTYVRRGKIGAWPSPTPFPLLRRCRLRPRSSPPRR